MPQAPYVSNDDELLELFKKIIPTGPWRLLEIGCGTGNHALHMAPHFKDLQWVATDILAKQISIKKNLKAAKIQNIHGPLVFEVGKDEFPKQKFNAVLASRLLPVLSWKQAKSLIKMLGNRLREGSQVIFYGPFLYPSLDPSIDPSLGENGFESEKIADLDKTLKKKNPQHGIRAFSDVSKAMAKAGFKLRNDYALSNANHALVFERLAHVSVEPK